MDETQYEVRSGKLNDEIEEVEYAIRRFTPENLVDPNEDIKAPLLNIETKFDAFRKQVQEFLTEFDHKTRPDWVQEWKIKLRTLEDAIVQNERNVKLKAVQLRESGKPPESESPSRDSEKIIVEKKADLKGIDLMRTINRMTESLQIGKVSDLEDHKIIQYLGESRSWLQESKEIDQKVLELKELVVVYPLPAGQAEEVDKLYESIGKTLKKVVSDLESEDDERMLYTLSKSNSKDPIPYPMFKSKPHEDVHTFITDFKDALIRNQIPKRDHVKILRIYLMNFALEIVHESLTNIDEAYEILQDQFGSSDQVFAAKFHIFLSECEGNWPSIEKTQRSLSQDLKACLPVKRIGKSDIEKKG